jgi:Fur family peroxide stress response transcriptional regulator
MILPKLRAVRVGIEDRERQMIERLRRSGLRMTAQRLAIVRTFASDLSHPTAQELFERLRAEFPQMSFATVYKTLDTLARAGLSGTLRLGSAARFDPNVAPHHHAVCEACGLVIDVPVRTLAPGAAARRKLERAMPRFHVRAVERVYRGLCPACASQAGRKPTQQHH